MVSLSFISIELFYEVQKCLTLIIKHMYFLSAFFHPLLLSPYLFLHWLLVISLFLKSPTDVVRNWEGFLWKIAVKLKAYEFMTSPLATHHWEQDFSIPLIEIMLTVDRGRFKSTSGVWSTLCIKPQIKSKVNEINPDLKF